MGIVNENFHILQRWKNYTYDDEYEWRDYFKDNIDGDGRPRHQLWKNERYTGQSFAPESMEADLDDLIAELRAAEKKEAARRERERAAKERW